MPNFLRASPAAVQLITDFEQFRDHAYLPTPHDKWTIAWGHTEGVKEGDTCDHAQGVVWLHGDMTSAEQCINENTAPALAQHEFDALVSFVFNVGNKAFEESTMLRKLNDSDFGGAAAEFPRWTHQAGVELPGLVRRRAAERQLFED